MIYYRAMYLKLAMTTSLYIVSDSYMLFIMPFNAVKAHLLTM
jgi:hypothetical protein